MIWDAWIQPVSWYRESRLSGVRLARSSRPSGIRPVGTGFERLTSPAHRLGHAHRNAVEVEALRVARDLVAGHAGEHL